LKADKDILEGDVDKVVDDLPEHLQSCFPGFGTSKQPWGWSCATDIWNPKGHELTIRGAYFSRGNAEDMAKFVAGRLRKKGYKIRTSRISE
jgi:hypothetical protein